MCTSTMHKSVLVALIICIIVNITPTSANLRDIKPLPKDFVKHLNRAVTHIRDTDAHNKIQSISVRYVRHFTEYNKMTMETPTGRITVPLTDKISKRLKTMVFYSIDMEEFRNYLLTKKYNLKDPIEAFRFVRNNTVQLDRFVKHLNKSFTRHRDIENPRQLHFYHAFKSNENMLTFGDLQKVTNAIKDILDSGDMSVSDIQHGKFVHKNFDHLSAGDCVEIGDLLKKENVKYTALFYTAAVIRLEYEDIPSFKGENLLGKLKAFYSTYGCQCRKQYIWVKEKLEHVIKLLEEKDENVDDKDTKDGKDTKGEKGQKGAKSDNKDTKDEKNPKETGNVEDSKLDKKEDLDSVMENCEDDDNDEDMCIHNLISQSKENSSIHEHQEL